MKERLKRRAVLLAAVIGATLVASSAVAFATTQLVGADGVIQACYRVADDDRKGELRAVSDATACRTNEAPLSWNIQGPKGDTGDVGPPGPSDGYVATRSQVELTPNANLIYGTLALPPGNYVVWARVGLLLPNVGTARVAGVDCFLYLTPNLGTIVDEGNAILESTPDADVGTIALMGGLATSASGNLRVACFTSTPGVIAGPIVLTAIKVGSLTTGPAA